VRALQLAVLMAALSGTSCARHSQERQALIDFFEAARLRDTTVLSNMGTATFEPRTDGIVQQFDIEQVDRRPLLHAFGGTVETKDVRLIALVRAPGGNVVSERLVATFQRLVGQRWTITQLRASRISPAASSVPPS
jgi:hypothetical protein